jgi:uncharacterized protein
MQLLIQQITRELGVNAPQVSAAIELLDGGATVPFIARYRKEATGGLDDIQLRALESRLGYLRELQQRRTSVIASIEEQGKMHSALRAALMAASTKQELEDLYLPYKAKRRTKGQIAREAGLEPLAHAIMNDPSKDPAVAAQAYVKLEKNDSGDDFTSVQSVLDGVRDVLSERWAEDANLVRELREWIWAEGLFSSRLLEGKDPQQVEVAKFRDYFDYQEPICRVPSHRALAVFRGRGQEILEVRLVLPESLVLGAQGTSGKQPLAPSEESPDSVGKRSHHANSLAEGRIAVQLGWQHQHRPADDLIRKCVAWTWRVKLSLSTERELFARLRDVRGGGGHQGVCRQSTRSFACSTRRATRRTGSGPGNSYRRVKLAVVDTTGKLVDDDDGLPA